MAPKTLIKVTLIKAMLIMPCHSLSLVGSALPRSAPLQAPGGRSKEGIGPLTAPRKVAVRSFPYWYDPRIHNWGNIGLKGFCHAALAPLATNIIDRVSYGGLDVRKVVLEDLPVGQSVLDLCCGVGFSTAPGAHGVDTSPQMLSVARLRRPDATFSFGNAETFGERDSYDVVTVMFSTHEMPVEGRRRVLYNAMRVARRSVFVVDIHPTFSQTLKQKPLAGKSFLTGEPYVLDYLERMDYDVTSAVWYARRQLGTSWKATKKTVLEDHVAMWQLDSSEV